MDVREKFTTDAQNTEESQTLMHYISRPGITTEEVTQVYDQWAKHYDKTISNIVWNAPKYGADEAVKYVSDKQAKILDAACGTGRGGVLLKAHGFTNIDALDASAEMIEESRRTGVYSNYICDFMGKNKLEVQADTYDAVVTVGSFVPGHVTEDCYEELVRITKPGGYIIIVMCERYFRENKPYTENIEPKMLKLQDQGLWTRVKREQVPNYHQDYDGILFVLQVNQGKNEKLESLK